MSVLLSALIAALPRALLALIAPLVTEQFLCAVLRRVVVAALARAAALSVNTVDDELVALVAERLKHPGEPP